VETKLTPTVDKIMIDDMTNDNLIGEKKMSDIIRDDDTSILKK